MQPSSTEHNRTLLVEERLYEAGHNHSVRGTAFCTCHQPVLSSLPNGPTSARNCQCRFLPLPSTSLPSCTLKFQARSSRHQAVMSLSLHCVHFFRPAYVFVTSPAYGMPYSLNSLSALVHSFSMQNV